MKHLAFLWLALLPAAAFSQTQFSGELSSDHFIYLFDGTMLKPGDYEVKKKYFTQKYFYLNGEEIPLDNIKFIQEKNGYFGNYRMQTYSGRKVSTFVPRRETGAYDIYYHIKGGGYGSLKPIYYAKDFGDLKPLTYQNLKADLSVFPNDNHPEEEKWILEKLETGRKRKKTRTITLWSGLGVFAVGGIINAMGEDKPSSSQYSAYSNQERTGLLISFAGIGGVVTSLLWPKPEKAYLQALRRYNLIY